MTIRTNRQWRQFKYREEVPAKVLADQFDWTDRDHKEHGDYSDGFIHYRGVWYHLADFERTSLAGWDGQHCDSFFSGVLVKVAPDGETYQIATFYS